MTSCTDDLSNELLLYEMGCDYILWNSQDIRTKYFDLLTFDSFGSSFIILLR